MILNSFLVLKHLYVFNTGMDIQILFICKFYCNFIYWVIKIIYPFWMYLSCRCAFQMCTGAMQVSFAYLKDASSDG